MATKFSFPFGVPFGFRQRASTVVAVLNDGTVATPPVLTLVGPLTDPEITLTYPAAEDVQLVFDGTVVSGDELVVDCAARTVLLNGTLNRVGLLVTDSSTWFELPPGESLLLLTAASSGTGAGLRVEWRSARE